MAKGVKNARAPIALALGVSLLASGWADAQPASSARRLASVERERGQAAADARRLRTEAAATQREISSLDRRLTENGRRRADAEAKAADAEQRLETLRLRAAEEGSRYDHNRDALENALIAVAFSENRIEPGARRRSLLAAIIAPDLTSDMRRGKAAILEAKSLEAQTEQEQAELAEARAAIAADRAEAETLIAQRRALRASQLADAASAERRAAQLARQARTLRELATRATAPQTARAAAPRPGILPAAWTAPAQGRIETPYGGRANNGGIAAQGATLATRPGAQVRAPSAATVAYAGQFRSYGQVLILNIDGGYAIVLAGMDALRARTGESLAAGQIVGEMSAAATPAPELYVEVRRDGRTIDPGGWLGRGTATQTASAR